MNYHKLVSDVINGPDKLLDFILGSIFLIGDFAYKSLIILLPCKVNHVFLQFKGGKKSGYER
jgi:hypothetical protein